MDESGDAGGRHRVEDPEAAEDVVAPGHQRLAGGGEQPGQVDDGEGAGEGVVQVVPGHVEGEPACLRRTP
jgi:hypothetical protein